MNDLQFIRLTGKEARFYEDDLASLRLKVFWEFPYLYEGTLEYEKNYLKTYFDSLNSFIFLVKDNDRIVGATTSILASDEEESFQTPFREHGLNPDKIFYFGESILLPEYRGKGLGKVFFHERESHARKRKGIEWVSFCAVKRIQHPLQPHGYKPLDTFWIKQGFHLEPGLTTFYEWKDRDEVHPSKKIMQYWLKQIGE